MMAAENHLRVGVIGCGNITLNGHGPALNLAEGVTPVAVADPIAARREEALDLLGLSREAGFESHRHLLEQANPDYVIVTVPQSLRSEIVTACAEHGVHVLSEKPIATRPAEGQDLADRMQAAGLQLGMVHNYLFYPEYIRIKQVLEQGEIGQLRHVVLNFMGVSDHPGHADYQPRWRHDFRHAGGGILMDMIHVLYLVEYFAGEPIQSVSAAIDNVSKPADEVEDLALLRLRFSSSYASVNLGWGQGPGGIEVTGTEGRALCFYRDYSTGPFADLEQLSIIGPAGRRDLQPRTAPPTVDNFVRVHEDFASAVREGKAPLADAAVGLRALEAALASYASALQGMTLRLPLDREGPLYQRGLEGLQDLPVQPGSPLVTKRLFGLGLAEGEPTP